MEASYFTANRRRLREVLEPDSFIAMGGFIGMQRDVDQPYEFQQDSNFWYLTGVQEPDYQLLIDVDTGEEWLLAPILNSYAQSFLGGLTAEQAAACSGIKNVVPKKEGKALLAKLLASKKRAYTVKPADTRVYGFQQNPGPKRMIAQLKNTEITDARLPLAKLRAIKQPAEITAIQHAVDITVDGMLAVIGQLKNHKQENDIDAQLYYEFRRRGATHGFDPVIASGAKTTVLHSPASNDPLKNWVLLDVGARLNNFTADITRTIPLRSPTDREMQVYQAVQRMHDHFEGLIKPGASVKEVLMKDAYPFVGEEMVKLGLINKPLLDAKHVFKFMPHGITHGLGIDTHDPLGRPETFAEGMVLTNEVGVYIPQEGIGIRIENDMVVTKDGVRNMAAKLPIGLDELRSMVY